MTGHDLDFLHQALDVALSVNDAAAAILLDGFRTGTKAHKKGTIDLVTQFDLASEAEIQQGLHSAFPDHRIVAEEGEPIGRGDTVWYVDPLDGTTNFAHGHPMFSISIALYRDAEPLVAVVCAPALGVTWQATRGGGTYRNGEPQRVSSVSELGDALCATGFPYDKWENEDNNVREFAAFLTQTQGVRRCGSAALDLALVADGTYDLYWEKKLQPWDLCAGALLVLESGGQLSDYHGLPADPRTGTLVATNRHLHAATLSVLERCTQQ